MTDHLAPRCVDAEAAAAFQLHVLAPRGIRETMCIEGPDGPVVGLHEPRIWPGYQPGYRGVFFRDLDGNDVDAVHHSAPPS